MLAPDGGYRLHDEGNDKVKAGHGNDLARGGTHGVVNDDARNLPFCAAPAGMTSTSSPARTSSGTAG